MTLPAGIIATTRADGREVCHAGSLWDGTAPVNYPGYQYRGIDVPSHGWLQQWTFRQNPIAIVRSPAQLVAANRMFPYGNTGCKVNAPPPRIPFTKPMDCSGIDKYMPTTGERRDIGLITDPSAYFMLGGSPDDMIDWAQAAGSCPMHFRDETTGRPIDLLKYPAANAADGPGLQGAPWLDKGPPIPASGTVYLADGVTLDKNAPGYSNGSGGYHVYTGGWTPQQAHYCEMSYVAHIATGDMGFLEDLQYSANFTVLADGYMSGARKIATVFGELRGISWAFRNLFMAHVATKDAEAAGTLPASCHPSSYWKTLLDNQLAYYTATYKNDPTNQYYRLVSGGNRFGPWQCDYMLSALAFGVLTGHSDWAPLYLWALGNVIARTNGTSGYPPGWGGAYYLNTCEWKQNPDGTFDQNTFDTTKPLDWAGTFLFQVNDPNGAQPTPAQIATLKADQLNGGRAMAGGEYLMTTRAVLVMAAYLESKGLVNVRAVYPELDTCVTTVERMVRNGGGMNPRQSVVMDASQAPTTIPPITPVTTPPPDQPPPQGDRPMKTFADLTTDIHKISSVADSATAALNAVVARLKAMAAAATGSGSQVDPAAIDALATELETHAAPLSAAIANVPPATS